MSRFNRKPKAKPSSTDDETVDLPLDLEVESQLDMFETEVNGEGVGDEEPDVDLEDDGDEIAEDVASSDTAAVTKIIQDAEKSIRLDPVPSDEVNVGRVSVAKVSV